MALYPYEGGTAKNPVPVKRWEINNRHHIKSMFIDQGWISQEGKSGWVLHSTGEVFDKQDDAVSAAVADYDGSVEFAVTELFKVFEDEIEEFYKGQSDLSG